MTPRFRELAEQCSIMFEASKQNRVHAVSTETLQRFAELIISDSIAVMKNHDYHAEWLGEKLKEHFGINE